MSNFHNKQIKDLVCKETVLQCWWGSETWNVWYRTSSKLSSDYQIDVLSISSSSEWMKKGWQWNASLVNPTNLFDITFLCFHPYQKLRIFLKIRQRQNNNTTWVNSSNVNLDSCCKSLLLRILVIAARTWSSFKVGPVTIRIKLNSSWYDK